MIEGKATKNILLTGATRGLGLSHARFLAKMGWNLALVDISSEACSVYGEVNSIDELITGLVCSGNVVRFFSCDLTDAEMTSQVFKTIIREFSIIHGLVANAGGDISGKDLRAAGGKAENNSVSINLENHYQIFSRNYSTCFNSIRAIIPHFKENKHGKIVTTASISAGYGVSQETAYAVSKAAVIHLTRCVATELREFNINVNAIAPGATLTGRFKATISHRSKEDQEKIFGQSDSFLKKPADPAYISSVVAFLLSEDANYINGQVIRVDGGQFTSPI